MVKLLKTELKTGRDFQIKDVRKLQNDGIAVDCPGQQDIDKILERISNNPSLQEKIKPIHVRQNFPKCIIYGLEPEFTKEQMEEALSQSFGEDHKDLKVLFPIKGRTGKTHWVFQTPVTIYRQLRRTQKLTIYWETHKTSNDAGSAGLQDPVFRIEIPTFNNATLKTNNLQAADQYGFTVNKSSEEAIVDFIDEIEMARSTKQYALVISLDIKSAFDHLEYNSIKNRLNNINFHSNTKEILIDLLSGRQVALNTPQGPATLPQHRGCPQGSCTGPAFWNLVANVVLTQSWPEGVHLQAFADNFIFLIKAPTKAKVKSLANEALNQFKSWTAKHNLEISADKSNYIHFNKNRNGPRLSAGIRWEANFDLEDRVSIVFDPHPPAEAIYTDGSHLEGETGCAFCVIQSNVQIHQWTPKLSPHNTVFQSETLAIKEAINWANSKGILTSIWSDSESALRAISSFKSSNPQIQETQQALLQNPSIQLNWTKAHVGFLGFEAADNLAKQATKEGTHLHLQAPKCHLKTGIQATQGEQFLIYSLKSL
ncbi:hypothetical protein AVEN_108566-1 [Araneus ventricosus]|uniref:Retrovirus-related Pol polyprotein from type-1 retrotransposable element R1 n=1 Tax=Araneus ventricosus TaxID=182803 RepID=A0A4Y2DII1_ARAVE|nr:hypothetical protein AVEN_108566-1 [Araneus ventricosus]